MTGMSHSVEDPERFSSSQSLQVQEYIVKFLHAVFYLLVFLSSCYDPESDLCFSHYFQCTLYY